jgi:hypothetical protein
MSQCELNFQSTGFALKPHFSLIDLSGKWRIWQSNNGDYNSSWFVKENQRI